MLSERKYLDESEKDSKRYEGEDGKPRSIEKDDDRDQDLC